MFKPSCLGRYLVTYPSFFQTIGLDFCITCLYFSVHHVACLLIQPMADIQNKPVIYDSQESLITDPAAHVSWVGWPKIWRYLNTNISQYSPSHRKKQRAADRCTTDGPKYGAMTQREFCSYDYNR